MNAIRQMWRSAVSDGKLSLRDAQNLAKLAKADGVVDADERVALMDVLALAPVDTFTPAAAVTLKRTADEGIVGRTIIEGSQQSEGLGAWDDLDAAVASGALLPSEQLLLARSASRIGWIGRAQAAQVPERLAVWSPEDRAALQETVATMSSVSEQAFLLKAVAAGYSWPEVKAFAEKIWGFGDEKVLELMNLADVTEDGVDTGLAQQFQSSCVPSTLQMLLASMDPIYALNAHAQNDNVHIYDNGQGNAALANEQRDWLQSAGGSATPRGIWGSGVSWDRLDEVYNRAAGRSGMAYSTVEMDKTGETVSHALDVIAGQLEKGIPVPLLVGSHSANRKHHAVLAMEVQGEGPSQRFLIADPWSAKSHWITRAEFESDTAPLDEFRVLGGYELAHAIS